MSLNGVRCTCDEVLRHYFASLRESFGFQTKEPDDEQVGSTRLTTTHPAKRRPTIGMSCLREDRVEPGGQPQAAVVQTPPDLFDVIVRVVVAQVGQKV